MMVKDGIYYALALVPVGAALSWALDPAAGAPFLVAALFCLYFFRDPERQVPAGPVAVSPADGRIVDLRPGAEGGQRVSIFLSVFDVHVNRSPIGGRICEVRYAPGKFKIATLAQASAENEQNVLVVEDGRSRVVFRQIAGLIARRIVCHKKTGDTVEKGERIGLIKFGSRMDVELGPEWQLAVRLGDRVKAGSTILASRPETGAG